MGWGYLNNYWGGGEKRTDTEFSFTNYEEAGKRLAEYRRIGKKAEDMLDQAKKLKAYYGEYLVVKLPAVKEGYKAVRLCKAEGICVCVTVVHSMTQALLAAKAGADFVAPYISHIDNIGADGVTAVEEMVMAFENGGYPCKVLGASFRTADQKCLIC